jgi:hypothetical protein
MLMGAYNAQNMGESDIPGAMKEWRSEIVEERNGLAEWLETVTERTGSNDDYILITKHLKPLYSSAGRASGMAAGDFLRVAKAWFVSKGFVYKEKERVRHPDQTQAYERYVVRGARVKMNEASA